MFLAGVNASSRYSEWPVLGVHRGSGPGDQLNLLYGQSRAPLSVTVDRRSAQSVRGCHDAGSGVELCVARNRE